jgi:hypothetical protein
MTVRFYEAPARDSQCIICFETEGPKLVHNDGGEDHVVHRKCIQQWTLQQPTCPVCRAGYDVNSTYSLSQKINNYFVSLKQNALARIPSRTFLRNLYPLAFIGHVAVVAVATFIVRKHTLETGTALITGSYALNEESVKTFVYSVGFGIASLQLLSFNIQLIERVCRFLPSNGSLQERLSFEQLQEQLWPVIADWLEELPREQSEELLNSIAQHSMEEWMREVYGQSQELFRSLIRRIEERLPQFRLVEISEDIENYLRERLQEPFLSRDNV